MLGFKIVLFVVTFTCTFSMEFLDFAELLRSLNESLVGSEEYSVYAEEGTEVLNPISNILDLHYSFIRSNAFTRILEIGPGDHPFIATHYIDNKMYRYNLLEGTTGWNLDIDLEKFPVEDNYFDFVYCRNVLQDINNPVHVFYEITRVGKNGYIETPSPAYSTLKFYVNRHLRFRGKYQHRFLVWTDKSTNQMFVLPKFPIMDRLVPSLYGNMLYERMAVSLLYTPLMKSNYYVWYENETIRINDREIFVNKSKSKIKLIKHDIDYNFKSALALGGYATTIRNGIASSIENTMEFNRILLG